MLQEVYHILKVEAPSLRNPNGALVAAIFTWDPHLSIVGDAFDLKVAPTRPGLRMRVPVIPQVSSHFVSQFHNRTHAILPLPPNETHPTYKVETRHLQDILGASKSQDAGLDGEYRVIFMHVALFLHLDKLPGLSEIRQRPEIHFFSYGTDATVPRQQWGVKPVFPHGERTF